MVGDALVADVWSNGAEEHAALFDAAAERQAVLAQHAPGPQGEAARNAGRHVDAEARGALS